MNLNILYAKCKTGLKKLCVDGEKLNMKSHNQFRQLMWVNYWQSIFNNIGDWVRLGDVDKSELGITLTKEKVQGVSKNVLQINPTTFLGHPLAK
jgi:hypothetical protein